MDPDESTGRASTEVTAYTGSTTTLSGRAGTVQRLISACVLTGEVPPTVIGCRSDATGSWA